MKIARPTESHTSTHLPFAYSFFVAFSGDMGDTGPPLEHTNAWRCLELDQNRTSKSSLSM